MPRRSYGKKRTYSAKTGIARFKPLYSGRQVSFAAKASGRPIWRARSTVSMNGRTGGFLGIETKFIDNTYSAAIVGTVAGSETDPNAAGAQTTPGTISGITVGTGESNRDGRKYNITSIHVKGDVALGADASVVNGETVRVALVLDTQTNGTQLNAEDVFLAASNVEHSFRNLQFTKRFRVLKSQTFACNPQAAAGNGTANDTARITYPFDWNVKTDIPVICSGTTNSITSISDNSLHMVAFSSGTNSELKYESRVRFQG